MRLYSLLAAFLVLSACDDGKEPDTGNEATDTDPVVDDDADDDGINVDEDCDDADATVGAAVTWYEDADADGYGTGELQEGCTPPAVTADVAGDCDDTNIAY